MRVLWFANTASNYLSRLGYNGGGWISSLETELRKNIDLTLAVSFILDDQSFKVIKDGVTYYPIACKQTSGYRLHLYSLLNNLDNIDQRIVEKCLKVIEDFKPDIIHVFGSEGCFGIISKHTSIPVILHIQGILQPIFNAFLPPMMSWRDYYFSDCHIQGIIKRISQHSRWRHNCKREKEIFKNIHYYCGRTLWDKKITELLCPQSKYFEVNEILRGSFYLPSHHIFPSKLTLISIISDIPFKGMDVILKTANILHNQYKTDLQWFVYGINDAKAFERLTNIRCADVGVKLCGVADETTLRDALLNATAFLSLSYIDNSPNSLCEAQILGCPVIATNVGGKASLVSDNENGFLVPANTPYTTAHTIMQLFKSSFLASNISERGKQDAILRHDKSKITSQLLEAYENVISNQECIQQQ